MALTSTAARNTVSVVPRALASDSRAAGTVLLDSCVERERAVCGAALYGMGSQSLYEALIGAMLQSGCLFTPAEKTACSWLNGPLAGIAGADRVYDSGTCGCCHPKNSLRLERAVTGTHPLARAQARIAAACRLTGADWSFACARQDEGDLLLVGKETGSWLLPLKSVQRPGLWAADLLRRAALGLPQAPEAVWLDADALARLSAADPETRRAAQRRTGLRSGLLVLLCAALAWGITLWLTAGHPGLLWTGLL